MVHLSDKVFAKRFSILAKHLSKRHKGNHSLFPEFEGKELTEKTKKYKKERDKKYYEKYYELNKERINARCKAYAAKKKEPRRKTNGN